MHRAQETCEETKQASTDDNKDFGRKEADKEKACGETELGREL